MVKDDVDVDGDWERDENGMGMGMGIAMAFVMLLFVIIARMGLRQFKACLEGQCDNRIVTGLFLIGSFENFFSVRSLGL